MLHPTRPAGSASPVPVLPSPPPITFSLTRFAIIALGLAAGVGFLIGLALDSQWLKMLNKPLPLLAMAWLVHRRARDRYATFVLIGLLFCLAGDMLLELNPRFFIPALLSFLAGHVMYVAAYLKHARALHLLTAVPCALYGIAMYAYLYPSLDRLAIPVAAYTFIICVMVWRAAVKSQDDPSAGLERWAVLIGALLFAASDSLLALNRFHAPFPYARYVIILLYWAGQAGIVLSVRPARSGTLPSRPPAPG